MNKKIRDMKMKIAAKVAEAKGFLDGENKDVEKATTILDEVESLKKELAALERAFALEEKEAESKAEKQLGEKEEQDVTEKFASVIRGMVRKDGTVTPMTEAFSCKKLPDGNFQEVIPCQINVSPFSLSKRRAINI